VNTQTQTPELTKNQTLVYAALDKADGPLSAYTILDQLRENGFRAPLQVYRALDKLLEYGLVHRLESLNAFIACSQPNHEAHGTIAFAICDSCSRVIEFPADKIARNLRSWARTEGFGLTSTTIEVRGRCEDC